MGQQKSSPLTPRTSARRSASLRIRLHRKSTALPAWRRTPPPQRANIIRRAGGILAERKQALGELVTRECGKPLTEGLGEVQEAIETLNDCTYGLSSAIYTKDVNKAMYAVREIEAGIVYVNGPTIGAEVHMPFGGVKSTGNGHREAGMTGLDIFTEWKTVYIDYSGALQRAQIDTN